MAHRLNQDHSKIERSDSIMGFLTDTSMPLWAVRLYAWWKMRGDVPLAVRLYDPVPTVASLDGPPPAMYAVLCSTGAGSFEQPGEAIATTTASAVVVRSRRRAIGRYSSRRGR